MAKEANADYLMRAAWQAGIRDPKELANFMAQMQVESGGFGRMSENLNYSPGRLLEIFPGRNGINTHAEAKAVTDRGPEAIANAIYGGRWGKEYLGNTQAGDGWKFHGRGYVQLTGRANYERVGRELGIDLVNRPELAADRDVAARIAIHYWSQRVVANQHQTDVKAACHDINGGYNGLAERRVAAQAWERKIEQGYVERHGIGAAVRIAREPATTPHAPSPAPAHSGASADGALSFGEKGPEVKRLQETLRRLGYKDAEGRLLVADGEFGSRTKQALESFQREHGLPAVGTDGPRTQAALKYAQAQLLTNPTHPHHGRYQEVLAKVHAAEVQRGIRPGPHSEQLAAALTVEVLRERIECVNRVELNAQGTLARAVQVHPLRDEAGLNRTTDGISTQQAMNQSVRESSEQATQVAINLRVQQEDQQRQLNHGGHASPSR